MSFLLLLIRLRNTCSKIQAHSFISMRALRLILMEPILRGSNTVWINLTGFVERLTRVSTDSILLRQLPSEIKKRWLVLPLLTRQACKTIRCKNNNLAITQRQTSGRREFTKSTQSHLHGETCITSCASSRCSASLTSFQTSKFSTTMSTSLETLLKFYEFARSTRQSLSQTTIGSWFS